MILVLAMERLRSVMEVYYDDDGEGDGCGWWR